MTEVIIPRTSRSVLDICSGDQATAECFLRNNPEVQSGSLIPGRAYCMANYSLSPEERAIVCPLNAMSRQERDNLSCIIEEYGDEAQIIATFYDRYRTDMDEYQKTKDVAQGASHANTFAGAGAAVYTARRDSFRDALLHYQDVLERLSNHTRVGRGPAAQKAKLQREAVAAYEVLNQRFQNELHKLVPEGNRGVNKRGNPRNKGNALSNAQRGLTLAERSDTQRIQVSNGYDQHRMGLLARGTRAAGPGFILLDAGIRYNLVRNEYRHGGDWQREAFVQSAGFGGATAAGIGVGMAAKAGLAAAQISLMATPVGWCMVIGTAAVVGYGLATGADSSFKAFAKRLWDYFD